MYTLNSSYWYILWAVDVIFFSFFFATRQLSSTEWLGQ